MQIGITGVDGFLGRYLLSSLSQKYHCIAWYHSSVFDANNHNVTWIRGELADRTSCDLLCKNCDILIHAAIDRNYYQSNFFTFLEKNILGSLALLELSRIHQISKFIYISSISAINKHFSLPVTHYGAVKNSIECFINSYSNEYKFDACSIRLAKIFGIDKPLDRSWWYIAIKSVKQDAIYHCQPNMLIPHIYIYDAVKAINRIVETKNTKGQIYHCVDRYFSEELVADLAKQEFNSSCHVVHRSNEKDSPYWITENIDFRESYRGEESLKAYIRELGDKIDANDA